MSLTCASSPPLFEDLRRTMVQCQIQTVDVTDSALLARFLEVPREAFLPPSLVPLAYSDHPLEIRALETPDQRPNQHGDKRYLFPPFILARLLQALELKPTDHVLNVGDGTGYSSALLAGLVKSVVALDSNPHFSHQAHHYLAPFHYSNIQTLTAPLTTCPSPASFDAILIHSAIENEVMDQALGPFSEALRVQGRLIAIWSPGDERSSLSSQAALWEKIDPSTLSAPLFLFHTQAPSLEAFRAPLSFHF